MDNQAVWVQELVARHVAVSATEQAAQQRFLTELQRLPDPFNEHADLTHVTASAVVVGRRGTVLHLHKRLGRWMQPGGHIDPGEMPPEAARRESIEELGLTVEHPSSGPRLLHLDVHEAALQHVHLDLRYLVIGPDEDPKPPPGESQEAYWFNWDVADAMADEVLRPALLLARTEWEAMA
jgi:8-oxo-dGTP pyrophosphatase MutT (NUDIX family)